MPKAQSEKKLRALLDTGKVPVPHRPYHLMTKNKLLAIARANKLTANSQQNKKEIIEKIVNRNQQGNNNDNTNNDIETTELAPLVAILQHSFLQLQKQKSECTAAKIGHRNEEKFLKEFWELSKNGKLTCPDDFQPMPAEVIFRPGIVAKKNGNGFVKDSADGVVVFKDNVSIDWFFLFLGTF